MRYLRWECIAVLRPFEPPGAGALGAPMASGLIALEDGTDAQPSDVITLPDAPDSAPFVLLRLEALGPASWIITLSAPGSTPTAGDGKLHAVDDVPRFLVPRQGGGEASRSIEVRAVKPGTRFVARTWA